MHSLSAHEIRATLLPMIYRLWFLLVFLAFSSAPGFWVDALLRHIGSQAIALLRTGARDVSA